MKTKINFSRYPVHSIVELVCVIALIAMGAYALYVPPKGDVTDNFLKLCWIITCVIAITQIRPILKEAQHFSFSKGDMHVDVTTQHKDDTPKPSTDTPS